jgi:hypothetical protein
MNFKGLYQVYSEEDYKEVERLPFMTLIPDFGAEREALRKGFNIIIPINPGWDFLKTVKEFANHPSVVGWYLPDEPNMPKSPYTIEGLKFVVKKIKEISDKPICLCIANINSGDDYKKWKEIGADILFADIYPFKADPEHWYRKSWEKGKLIGRIFRFFYGIYRVIEDSFRMRKAIKAGYKEVCAVTQGFGSKKGGGKFYFPTAFEYRTLMKMWKLKGIKNFFVFCWDMNIPEKNYRGIKIDKKLIKEVTKW